MLFSIHAHLCLSMSADWLHAVLCEHRLLPRLVALLPALLILLLVAELWSLLLSNLMRVLQLWIGPF